LHLVRIVKPLTREEELQSLDLTAPKNFLHMVKEDMFSTAEHLREGLAAPAVAQLKLPITWSVVVDTDVAKALSRVAENGGDAEETGGFGGYDVIAMATHARSGLQRWALGSITEQVLHDTQLPLFIVHPVEMMDRTPLIMSRPRVTITKD
jgi:nucleotide-binding universal stress UspA family protein